MKWISVKDEMPQDNDEVLIWSKTLQMKTPERVLKPYSCFFYNGFKAYGYGSDSQNWLDSIEITHWMPLPEPPLDSETLKK